MNTVTRSEPSRSRARRSGWRLTCTRLRPVGLELRLEQQLAALALGLGPHHRDGAPRRTRASVGAPRNDDSVASQASASSRLVLPSPLCADQRGEARRQVELGDGVAAEVGEPERCGPARGQVPAAGQLTRTGMSRYRKSWCSGLLHHRRLERVDGLDDDLVARHDLDALQQVVGVERHGQLGALVLGVERLVGLADVLGDGHQLEALGSTWPAAPAWPRGPAA